MRNTKTEYVSCPSCGRTLFDLQEVTDQIRTKTGHLPGVSIAVMGGSLHAINMFKSGHYKWPLRVQGSSERVKLEGQDHVCHFSI